MSKRKTTSMLTDTTFVVIETVKGRGDVFVELIPNVWLKLNKNQQIKVRESAKYYYPRQSPDQSKEVYLKFLRSAKFECLQPLNNKKWDLLDCRVLKIGIGSFEEAVNAEKLFSEYFFTTDAEAEMAPSQTKRSKKTKKAAAPRKSQPSYDSESEEDSPGTAQIKSISCYDTDFKIPAIHCDATIDAMDETSGNVHPNNQLSSVQNSVSSCLSIGVSSISPLIDMVDAEVIDGATMVETVGAGIDEIAQLDIEEDPGQPPVIFEFVDQRKGTTSTGSCNCCQKVLNKMDYFQKKVLKEVGRYRQETMQAIRQFTDRYDVLLKSEEFKLIVPEEDLAKQVLDEEFETQFTKDFPVKTSLLLMETDHKIKSDRQYKKRFIAKLKRKEKEPNEVKAVRKLLKSLCAASCLSDFTWLGTTKKENFSALESLIGVLAQIVEEQFPNCDAYKIIKEVVQQRTKSAADFVASSKKIVQQTAGNESEREGDDAGNDRHEQFNVEEDFALQLAVEAQTEN